MQLSRLLHYCDVAPLQLHLNIWVAWKRLVLSKLPNKSSPVAFLPRHWTCLEQKKRLENLKGRSLQSFHRRLVRTKKYPSSWRIFAAIKRLYIFLTYELEITGFCQQFLEKRTSTSTAASFTRNINSVRHRIETTPAILRCKKTSSSTSHHPFVKNVNVGVSNFDALMRL